MTNEVKQRLVELLEQDAAQMNAATEHWKELERDGAVFEDSLGRHTAAEMIAKYSAHEKAIRELINSLKA